MIIEINDTHTIGEIRQKFSKSFPFLRIEFFLQGSSNLPKAALQLKDLSLSIGSIRKNHAEGKISITGKDSVRKIEESFRDRFGLEVQIFRRSGNTWLVTTTTDELTLNQQNEIAGEMATMVEPSEPPDIHEQD